LGTLGSILNSSRGMYWRGIALQTNFTE
jgi:hypothetical protein